MHVRLSRLALIAGAAGALCAGVDPQQYLDDIKFLASDQLKGRATGSPELEKAGQYIARQFHAAGLKPVESNGYLQAFSVTTNARLGRHNQFEYSAPGKDRVLLTDEEDFVPFNMSASGKNSGPAVFAGYGITAPEYNYDDYAGLDVKDKIVVVLRHEPQEFDEKSVFAGKNYTEHSQFSSKAINAKMHGARAVILINDMANHPGEGDQLEKFGRTAGPSGAGIAFVQVKEEAAEPWFEAAGRHLKEIEHGIDRDLHPRSFEFPLTLKIEFNVDVQREVRTVHNVAGYLPGETDEYVVVGAHYDHLGLGEQYSMAPSLAGTPHLGADDNASGTAGVIELARWFAAQPKQRRGILFLTFAGEELGLLGSSYWVNHPDLPIGKAVAMINMDMIGRVRDRKIIIGGAGTGSNFKQMLEPLLKKFDFKADLSDQIGYGSSDHTSFTTKRIPVLFFFSGLHEDYHRPSDTWEKITAPETAQLLDLIATVTAELATEPDRPRFITVSQPASAHGGAPGASSGSGYGPDFGSIPDFTDLPNGVRFADVRPGSPAAKAGLKGGDILTEFDGKAIQNLYDFTYALRSKRPGDEVLVKVLRDGAVMETKVLLSQRK